MDEKHKEAIRKIVELSKQNKEFDEELREQLNVVSAPIAPLGDERLNQIYEYCIEEIVKQQAEDFYKDFPIQSIVPQLKKDFIRMEHFRRKDNFNDFCMALYQQIEGMTNNLCERKDLADIVDKMWAYPAYVKDDQLDIEEKIRNRTESKYTIADLIFKKSSKTAEKTKTTLQNQYANDKMRIVVYFVKYLAAMVNSDYRHYVGYTDILNDIYLIRNTNHRGNTSTEWEQISYDRIDSHKTLYYLKFLGALAEYVDFIKNNLNVLFKIKTYANSLPFKTLVISPKVVGKINLKDR